MGGWMGVWVGECIGGRVCRWVGAIPEVLLLMSDLALLDIIEIAVGDGGGRAAGLSKRQQRANVSVVDLRVGKT